MKKLYFTTVLLILIVRSSTAQFYTQYFDGADTSIYNAILIDIVPDSSNVWQIGTPQKSVFDSAATLPNAIVTDTINFYPSHDTSSFIAKVYLNGNNWGIFALQWKQKLDMDTSFDGGIIEYSIDTGNTWINVFNNPYVYNFTATILLMLILYRVENLLLAEQIQLGKIFGFALTCLGFNSFTNGTILFYSASHYYLIQLTTAKRAG